MICTALPWKKREKDGKGEKDNTKTSEIIPGILQFHLIHRSPNISSFPIIGIKFLVITKYHGLFYTQLLLRLHVIFNLSYLNIIPSGYTYCIFFCAFISVFRIYENLENCRYYFGIEFKNVSLKFRSSARLIHRSQKAKGHFLIVFREVIF